MTTYILNQDGSHYTEDEDLDRMIGLAEDFIGSTTEPTTFTIEGQCGMTVSVITNRRISGTFTKQVWGGREGDEAIFVEEIEFDATDAVLRMSLDEIQSLNDNSESTDELGRKHVQWQGPCEVKVIDSMLDFFGVDNINRLTEDALRYARNRLNPVKPIKKTVTLTVEVEVSLFAKDERERTELLEDFFHNLDYSVLSNTVGATVLNTEITNTN